MNLEFDKVSYDRELSDFSEEELRELVEKFEDAQESNVAEFKTAAEAANSIDESTIEDFEDARERLIGEIADAEAFDEVPLTEEKLEDEDFSDLREWQDFVQEEEDDSTPEEDGDFDDMGQKAPVNSEDEQTESFVEDALGEVQGLNL